MTLSLHQNILAKVTNLFKWHNADKLNNEIKYEIKPIELLHICMNDNAPYPSFEHFMYSTNVTFSLNPLLLLSQLYVSYFYTPNLSTQGPIFCPLSLSQDIFYLVDLPITKMFIVTSTKAFLLPTQLISLISCWLSLLT